MRPISIFALAMCCGVCASDLSLFESGFATVVIEESRTGRRVRNLFAAKPLEAGTHKIDWDGYDDLGKPCAAGCYRWRGLVRGDVKSRYLGAYYSPGNPPWRTKSRGHIWNMNVIGAGGWLSDHCPPLCVASGGDEVFIGAETAEAGCAMIRVDAGTGRKIWGTSMIALIGASAFARDGDTLFIAGEGGWSKDKFRIVRIDLKTSRFVKNPRSVAEKRNGANIYQKQESAFVEEWQSSFSGIRGMALTPDEIVVSLADKGGRVVCFSRETADFVREIALPGAGQLAVAPDNAIWAVCENGVARLGDGERSGPLDISRVVCLTNNFDLVSPRGLAIGPDSAFYVSDIAPERQCVVVFSSNGKHVRTIGKPGGRSEGKFDPSAMSNPVSVCIDVKGLVWVAENEVRPKRVSVWNPATGELVRDYVGTPYYGGGGSIDVVDGFAYYDGMRFRLSPDLSGATLDAIVYRPEEHPEVPSCGGAALLDCGPSVVRKWRGRTFIVPGSGYQRKPFIGEVVGDRLMPRVATGAMVVTNAAGKSKTVGAFLWQNGKRMERKGLCATMLWSACVGPGLEIVMRIPSVARDWQTDALGILRPDENLHYDFDKMQRIEMPDALRGMVYSCNIAPDGKSIVVNAGSNRDRGENVIAAIAVADGHLLWSYPNPYPSNGHNSPLPAMGDLRHTCGFEGWSGEFFQLNGNKGTRYLFTRDGLFVAELFGDQRISRSHYALHEIKHGDILSEYSLQDECFGGWFGDGKGGTSLQIVGKNSLSICEVMGLAGVRRLDGGVISLVKSPPLRSTLPPSEQAPVDVMDCGAFGFQRDWQKAVIRPFPEDKVAEVAFGVSRSGGNPDALRVFVKVHDASPWVNGGMDPDVFFKSGDCVDLRWAVDPKAYPKRRIPVSGDIRILFAPDGNGGVTAVKYVFVDSSVVPESRRSFTSPTGTAYVDRVERVSIKASVVKAKNSYVFTADIPWRVLGEKGMPAHGELRRADVGVLFGDSEGSATIRRAYLFDRKSQVVSDLPSEVRVCPANWGNVRF